MNQTRPTVSVPQYIQFMLFFRGNQAETFQPVLNAAMRDIGVHVFDLEVKTRDFRIHFNQEVLLREMLADRKLSWIKLENRYVPPGGQPQVNARDRQPWPIQQINEDDNDFPDSSYFIEYRLCYYPFNQDIIDSFLGDVVGRCQARLLPGTFTIKDVRIPPIFRNLLEKYLVRYGIQWFVLPRTVPGNRVSERGNSFDFSNPPPEGGRTAYLQPNDLRAARAQYSGHNTGQDSTV